MASEVKTNKISPATGTDVTLGDSSDTFTLPSGSAITVASGGDINVASGGEIDIAGGATLDVNGTIDVTGATTTGFPGGLDNATQWRLTADFTGDAAPIATNLEEADTWGAGTLGSSMTQSSGIFTFPSTGYWLVRFHADFTASTTPAAVVYNEVELRTTLDNGSTLYNSAAMTSVGLGAASHWSGATTEFIFDVTDTTLCKCRFDINVANADVITMGNTGKNETFFTFIKLADT